MAKLPSPGRLEAFSDGVMAVIITIMVLEFKVPKEHGLAGPGRNETESRGRTCKYAET